MRFFSISHFLNGSLIQPTNEFSTPQSFTLKIKHIFLHQEFIKMLSEKNVKIFMGKTKLFFVALEGNSEIFYYKLFS
jgi:hypothetical protein